MYHSHFLEHLDRHAAEKFLGEVCRVLHPGGVLRIVVPNIEFACRRYLEHFDGDDGTPTHHEEHDAYVGAVIEQLVRTEAYGTSRLPTLRRVAENVLLGSAPRRGETHRWMYDRINLADLLVRCGFVDITTTDYCTSAIPGWEGIGLDRQLGGSERKPGSLYMEARK